MLMLQTKIEYIDEICIFISLPISVLDLALFQYKKFKFSSSKKKAICHCGPSLCHHNCLWDMRGQEMIMSL